MRKYLTEYLKRLEEILASEQEQDFDYEELLRSHLTMIQFMQHERLIHFLVTMLFAICFFIALGIFLMSKIITLSLLLLLILVLLVPYISHYYFLENSVQKMYRLYDEINARIKKNRVH
ncbi:MAG: hypothetical protein IKI58_07330 [Oscillospiraceae bacterium]|nr:hypothetical protein [Oscillospiraceae bacterium]